MGNQKPYIEGHNTMAKKKTITKGQKMVYKRLHRKLKMEQDERR